MVTTREMNKHKENGCMGYTLDKKYFLVGTSFIKRTLRPHEWMKTANDWKPSAAIPQRWKTDAAVIQYLREHTDIPLPRLQHTFEDDGAFYFSTEIVPGVNMSELPEKSKGVVHDELMKHVDTLKSLTSNMPGVPGQALMCAPVRVHAHHWKPNSCFRPDFFEEGEYVFCHNDLGQHNIIVDPITLKINAIIDWEYAGFWPEWFEKPYWKRLGPSAPMRGEDDDRDRCRQWLADHCEEVEMKHLMSMADKVANSYKANLAKGGN